MGAKTRVLRDFKEFSSAKASSVCLGNFDGMHRAHKKILLACLVSARRQKLKSVAFTFNPHPSKFFSPKTAPKLLMTYEEKRNYLLKLGFDFVLEQKFDAKFTQISAEHFVAEVLAKKLKTQTLIVGPDFKFGFKATGNINLIEKMNLFKVAPIQALKEKGTRMSSTWIRKLVAAGKVEEANRLLGHFYFLSGSVVKGFQRGRKLGFPTANIRTEREALPKPGIYMTLFKNLSNGKIYPSVTSLGFNPTFKNSKLAIESHLLDFSGNLYSKHVRLYFLKWLRSEKKFSKLEALQNQIFKDVQGADKFFSKSDRRKFDDQCL